jgi:hypothetical protein
MAAPTRSLPGIVALTLAASLGCAPSAFDKLAQGARDAAAQESETGTGSDHDAASEDAASEEDRELDAASATGPLDGAGASQGDAEPESVDGGEPDASPCVSMTRPLPARPRVTELARLALPSVFGSRVLGPSQRVAAGGRAWILLSNQRASDLAQPASAPQNHPLLAYDGDQEPWTGDGPLGAAWMLDEQSTAAMAGPALLALRKDEPADSGLWPLSLIGRGAGETGTLAYVLQTRAMTATAVWLATMEQGSYLGMRSEAPLFTEPPFFVHAARRDGGFVYLYACSDPLGITTTNSCVVGRAPEAQISERAAYRVAVRAGSGAVTWSADLKAGTPMLENVYTQLSISYNDHLRTHLAVYGEANANHAVLRTASVPQGPWSAPVRVPLAPPLVGHNHQIREHASIVQRCESRIMVSYFSPTRLSENGKPSAGDVVLVAIDLE